MVILQGSSEKKGKLHSNRKEGTGVKVKDMELS